jgi:hypothetical protein
MVIAMNKRLLILILIAFEGIAFADLLDLVPYTQVQEKEVKSFVTIGMDQKVVAAKFGPPNLTDTGKDGLEVWQYFINPRVARDAHSSYYGFEVFFTDKKVTYLGIIRGKSSGN